MNVKRIFKGPRRSPFLGRGRGLVSCAGSPPIMNVKRVFSGPWLWIFLGVVVVLGILQFVSNNSAYEEISTDEMVQHINEEEIDKITFVEGEQEMRATLDEGAEVRALWLGTQGNELL